MKNKGKIVQGAAVLWAALALGSAQAAVADGTLDNNDPKKINACMAMSAEALAKDADCTTLMKSKNITIAEMQTMKTCKAMKLDTMAQDETCSAMTNKFPDMMKPTQQ